MFHPITCQVCFESACFNEDQKTNTTIQSHVASMAKKSRQDPDMSRGQGTICQSQIRDVKKEFTSPDSNKKPTPAALKRQKHLVEMSGSYLLFYLGIKRCGTMNTSVGDMKVWHGVFPTAWDTDSKTGTDRLLFTQIWPAAVTCADPDKPTSHCSLNSSMPRPLVMSPMQKIWNDHCQSPLSVCFFFTMVEELIRSFT